MPRAPVKLVQVILQKDETDAIRLQTDLYRIQGKRYSAIPNTLFAFGLRAGEVARLKTSSVNFDARYIFIYQSKGEKDRVVPGAPVICIGTLPQLRCKITAESPVTSIVGKSFCVAHRCLIKPLLCNTLIHNN